MATNFVQPGHVLTIPAPGAIAPGDVVIQGELIGIAAGAAAEGEMADVHMVGVWMVAKVAGDDMGVGDAIYFDTTTGLATTTEATNVRLGIAVAAAGSGAATVAVRLDG